MGAAGGGAPQCRRGWVAGTAPAGAEAGTAVAGTAAVPASFLLRIATQLVELTGTETRGAHSCGEEGGGGEGGHTYLEMQLIGKWDGGKHE